jgi:membrane-bound serine protease (ClpP class)
MIDPNVVYFVLVCGLWLAVTSAYIPGTGVVELVSLVVTGAAIVMLSQLPTNWAGVLLLIIGVLSFLMVPLLNHRIARYAEAGLVLQLIGALILFHGMTLNLLLIGVTIGLSLAYHRLVLLPVLEKARQHTAVIDDNGQLVGATGYVAKTGAKQGSRFVGSIQVRGEQWTAWSDVPLKIGDEVMVISRDGLQLRVENSKRKVTNDEA